MSDKTHCDNKTCDKIRGPHETSWVTVRKILPPNSSVGGGWPDHIAGDYCSAECLTSKADKWFGR